MPHQILLWKKFFYAVQILIQLSVLFMYAQCVILPFSFVLQPSKFIVCCKMFLSSCCYVFIMQWKSCILPGFSIFCCADESQPTRTNTCIVGMDWIQSQDQTTVQQWKTGKSALKWIRSKSLTGDSAPQ